VPSHSLQLVGRQPILPGSPLKGPLRSLVSQLPRSHQAEA
jgi:CRISPR/Cas system CSM-associated protein Csm3 (group 7 of RAMP superfamily)